jgi:predicted HTH domain antitoxin
MSSRYVKKMATVHVELPADLAARLDPQNVSLEAARLIALELYREQKISLGLAARLSATPLAAFMDFAAHHGVAPLRYSHEDLDEELKSIERRGA